MSADVAISGASAERRGPWMKAWDGSKLWPLDPRIGDLKPVVIANALARINRFGGHLAVDNYSVAQHSVLVSRNCRTDHALIGLLHDAHEAVIGDVVQPLAEAFQPSLSGLKASWSWAIGCTFDLANYLVDLPEDVKRADLRALWTEKRDLLAPGPTWGETPAAAPFDEVIEPWPVQRSVHEWMARFHALYHGIAPGAEKQLGSSGGAR